MGIADSNKGYIWTHQSIDTPETPYGTQEFETRTCNHCNTVVYMNPLRQRERQTCKKCYAYICDYCSPMHCTPVMQAVELRLDLYGPHREPLPTIYHSGATIDAGQHSFPGYS